MSSMSRYSSGLISAAAAGKCVGTGLSRRSGRRLVSSSSTTHVQVQHQEQAIDQHVQVHVQSHSSPTHINDSSNNANASSSLSDADGLTGSAKLLADALLEESSQSSSSNTNSDTNENLPRSRTSNPDSVRVAQIIHSHTSGNENWTGEERIQDAVLRMLVDKYKPLRGPVVRSAEEKMRDAPPSIRSGPNPSPSESSATGTVMEWEKRAHEPLLPAVEGHRPWNTTFSPPSLLTARVKVGTFSPPSSARRSSVGEDGGVKVDTAAMRRSATAQRLGRARESTLDYKLGLSSSSSSSPSTSSAEHRRPPPTTPKAWSSLIEERIERARLEGQFTRLSGRGKPLVREDEERNPFIAREEFLMNRIVQRNSACPAWVELQGEVENAIQTFRTILRQSWTRRAILLLTSSHPSPPPSSRTLTTIRALRDSSWIQRESSYHASALAEVNELVRRYNGVAPYAVRKPYFEREKELKRCFWESAEDVLRGVRERERVGKGGVGAAARGTSGEEEGGGAGKASSGGTDGKRTGIWEMIRAWITSLRT